VSLLFPFFLSRQSTRSSLTPSAGVDAQSFEQTDIEHFRRSIPSSTFCLDLFFLLPSCTDLSSNSTIQHYLPISTFSSISRTQIRIAVLSLFSTFEENECRVTAGGSNEQWKEIRLDRDETERAQAEMDDSDRMYRTRRHVYAKNEGWRTRREETRSVENLTARQIIATYTLND
jgi:hypothetical protein